MTKFLLLLACCISSSAFAHCFEEASAKYGVDSKLLKSIAKVESNFNQNAIGKNKNGSVDIGLMQINSSWLPTLAKYGITRETLINDACINVKVGAWVMASNIKQLGNNWKAVGAYNSPTRLNQQIYAEKVSAVYYGRAPIAAPVTNYVYPSKRGIFGFFASND